MAKRLSRRYQKAAANVDQARRYGVDEGISLIKNMPAVKFDETVDVAVRIGIDPKKTEQLVRGSVSLPRGTGKSIKIAVFAEGQRAQEALAAGADFVGGADLAEQIEKGVGKRGKVLGPQGKMPSPKAGTVTPNVAAAVKEFKAGKIEFRTDAGANVHAAIGKKSFSADDLIANLTA